MKKVTITEKRKSYLRCTAKCAGFRVGFSDDNKFAWIIVNDYGKAYFMKSIDHYDCWKLYECDFKGMVNKARLDALKEQEKVTA